MHDLAELTARCIHCGLCLEACPTFVVTGSELESPRGRVYLVRSAMEGKLRWQEDVREHLDRCLGCLACTTACPSGVRYGSILEIARDKLESERPAIAKSMLLKGLTTPAMLKASLLLPGKKMPAFVSRALSGREAEAETPRPLRDDWPPLDESALPPVRGEVYLLEGCAMRVLFPRVHRATRRLLRRVGYAVREVPQGCCGALHEHAGRLEDAARMAGDLMAAMPDDIPVITDSAGCGSTMKGYPEPSFSDRVFDVSEFLLEKSLAAVLKESPGVRARVTYHDACHLAHGQGVRRPPRELLEAVPGLELVELPESDMCCGSAGTYHVVQPTLARALLERKWANVVSTGASIVALGNPGCHAWIAQAARERSAGIRVLHTMELLEEAFRGDRRPTP